MKKALYASTALVAAGLIAVASSDVRAQTAAPAPAQKLQVAIGGFMLQTVGYADQNNTVNGALSFAGAATTTGVGNRKHFDQKSDSEIYFKGSVNLDNGLTVSLIAELEADIDASSTTASLTQSQTSQWDETYMTIGNADVGTLYLGATNAAIAVLGVSAPWAGLNPYDGTLATWILSPSTQNATASSAPTNRAGVGANTYNGSFDYSRVEYITPSFAGLRLGGGYAPSTTASQVQPGVSDTDHTDLGFVYAPTFFDGFTPRLYGGYWRVNGSATGVTDNYSGGVDVKIADFIIGGGYATAIHRKNGISSSSDQPDVSNWNVGVKYAPGPFAIALTYGSSNAEGRADIAADDTHRRISLGAEYVLGPGVTLIGDVFASSTQDETNGAGTSNRGWAAVTGVKLDF